MINAMGNAWRKALYKLSGELRCRLIKLDDREYLERYYAGRLFGFTFYLHRFVAPDAERHVHDHPWRIAMSIVLAGRYQEEWVRCLDTSTSTGWQSKLRNVRWLNWIPGHRFHRIAGAKPETWTLFIHVARTKNWGFLKAVHKETSGGSTTSTWFSFHEVEFVMYVPHPSAPTDWINTAPRGKNVGRSPFNPH